MLVSRQSALGSILIITHYVPSRMPQFAGGDVATDRLSRDRRDSWRGRRGKKGADLLR